MLIALLLLGCTTDIGIVTKECTTVYYPDSDGDGFGDDTNAAEICETEGYVSVGGDCDDGDAEVYPDATEVCDGVDNDCDGDADDDDQNLDASTTITWYGDQDSDGYGADTITWESCEAPDRFVGNADDCDDLAASVNPAATETCNGLDDDCDGGADDDAVDVVMFYQDADSDGHGDVYTWTEACTAPDGFVAGDDDCDDTTADVSPDAPEVCDGLDDDCDGEVDEDDAADALPWYADADRDGYGDPSVVETACDQPSGYTDDTQDCDDSARLVNPGAVETCDGVDNDCDGLADEDDAVDTSLWYADADADGYGDTLTTKAACDLPSGYADNDDDCDDSTALASPALEEVCDDIDNDCDGSVDESSATDAVPWYADKDSDGFGDLEGTSVACEAPTGSVADASDCDDLDGEVNPEATELCDEVDNDCDGSIDEDSAADADTWYQDDDDDGYGVTGLTTSACSQPAGYAALPEDCDDTNPQSNPGTFERCDAEDNDCDGDIDEHPYSDDFSGSEDETVFSVNGDGSYSGGQLLLTDAVRQASTAFLLDPLATDILWVSFDFTISGGYGTSGADGVTFFIVDPSTDPETVKNEGSDLAVKDMDGWIFAVDTYGNSSASSGDVLVLRDGDSWTDLNSASLSQMQGTGAHSFDLYLDNGTYTAYIDGALTLSGTLPGWVDQEYLLGVSGATGSAYNRQVMDDLYFGCPD